MHRSLITLMFLLGSSTAFANDLVGQASIIDGDTLEIHGTRIRLWGVDAPESSQLCRGADSNLYRCGANAANDLDTFIARRPVNCTPVSEDQYGRSVAICSVGGADLGENGLFAMVSRWIGRNIRKGSTTPPSAKPIVRGGGFGRAATWRHGCFAGASGPAAPRPTVRMMQTHILECAPSRRFGASVFKG
jgi:hypothetical protein